MFFGVGRSVTRVVGVGTSGPVDATLQLYFRGQSSGLEEMAYKIQSTHHEPKRTSHPSANNDRLAPPLQKDLASVHEGPAVRTIFRPGTLERAQLVRLPQSDQKTLRLG